MATAKKSTAKEKKSGLATAGGAAAGAAVGSAMGPLGAAVGAIAGGMAAKAAADNPARTKASVQKVAEVAKAAVKNTKSIASSTFAKATAVKTKKKISKRKHSAK